MAAPVLGAWVWLHLLCISLKYSQVSASGVSCEESDPKCEFEQGALLQLHSSTAARPSQGVPAAAPPNTQLDATSAPIPQNSGAQKWRPDRTSELMGVTRNAEGDLCAFSSNLALNFAISLVALLSFCALRQRFPLMYSNNTLTGAVGESQYSGSFFGWIYDALFRTPEEVERVAGLDAFLLLEFCTLCMRISVAAGLPLLCIIAPLHLAGGHGEVDRLSRLGLGHVPIGHWPWLGWVHAGLVWYVVIAVQYLILQAQRAFVQRRYAWLRAMPAPQSTTVLVEFLPAGFRSDATLLKKFQDMFGEGSVTAASVVRQTETLRASMAALARAEQALHQAEFQWEKEGLDPTRRPHFRGLFGELRDSIEHHTTSKQQAHEAVAQERARLAADTSEETFSSSGFVTFATRRDQELALLVDLTLDEDEFVVSLPPDPADVLYSDLAEDPQRRMGREVMGELCIVGLFLGFTPFVVGGAQLMDLGRLSTRLPVVGHLLELLPSLGPLLESLAAVLALKFFMLFLPTVLMMVFRNFFCLRAEAWAQLKLQSRYFWFLVVFEILVTSVGSSLTDTTKVLLHHPLKICVLLADTLPRVSHFYLNFIVFTCGTHFTNITRYFNLLKFLALRTICKEQRAQELSEPEDQDWYGFGGRSARFTEVMLIGILFSSLSPLMLVLTLLNFAICRLVYGYLLVFAETRKPDLGGHYWVTQMDHLMKGLLIYIFTMIGVLLRRCPTRHPACLAVCAVGCWALGYRRFHALYWRALPLQELNHAGQSATQVRHCVRTSYIQPELLDSKMLATTR